MSVPCPSCLSRRTAKFILWKQKGEWIYVCREEDMAPGNESPCGNMWIESERVTECNHCKAPLSIELRKKVLGYWCQLCDLFPITPIKSDKIDWKSLEESDEEAKVHNHENFIVTTDQSED
jgi:hypothetical protein